MDYKKMLAVSAALIGTAAMAVESSVVGYAQHGMDAGETIYRVATFEGVAASEATFTLSQISVGDEDFAWWNGDYVATVDAYGGQDQYYTWDPDASGWFECDDNCVVDPEKPADNVVLPINRGIIVFSANGASLTFSGAVLAGDTALYGNAGDVTYTGNFTPATLTLGDLVVGEEDFAWWNGDYIATINPYGGQDQYYTWDPDASGWFECDDNCVVDPEKPANDVEFEPNMGFLFFTANGAELNVPSPL